MEKQKVYIETSVISYLTANPSKDIVVAVHQQITNEWWHKARQKFDCYISDVVLAEIEKGDSKAALSRIDAVKDIRILEYNPEIEKLGLVYLELFKIPDKSKLDAAHLALSVWYNIDILMSWNCKHIANALVNIKLRENNNRNGLFTPILCTPEELLEANDD